MRLGLAQQLCALTILLAALQVADASQPIDRLLRRQSGEGEQESTTPKAQEPSTQQSPNGNQSPRLYPDLPRQPNFLPPFNAPPSNGPFPSGPFVPFGIQMPPQNRLNADQQPAPFGRMPQQPRPMTPAERLQSQSFANGLGRRLLSMVGINMPDKTGAQVEASTAASGENQPAGGQQQDETTKALQNATVLQQLNTGLHSIYGNLAKMYNSTVQQQLNMLQDRFKQETANSSNPWQQRMAQQVPAFFQHVAGRLESAQERLNRIWRDATQANSSKLNEMSEQPRSFFGSFDQFLNDPSNGDFLMNNFGGPNQQGGPQATNQSDRTNMLHDIAAKVRNMWHTRVEPELVMIRGQMSRVWRDLMGNSAVAQESVTRTRQGDLGASQAAPSSDLVDNILKEVDMNSPEYTLVDPKAEASSAEPSTADQTKKADQQDSVKLNPQLQNGVVEMQADLNRLWMRLANSLQSATENVKKTLNPMPRFGFMNQAESSSKPVEVSPEQNEISDKIKDLSRLQRDADMVSDAVQQQQREAQRQSMGDRFRGFFNNVDMRGINQLPDRIGEQFNRFGNAVGNFWNRIPERWDSFMTNVRQPQQNPQMGSTGGGGSSSSSSTMASLTTTTAGTTTTPTEK